MSVIRLIYVRVDPKEEAHAEEIWKLECAPLMIQQKGCLSEKLLKCCDRPGEYISYSEWDSFEDIERYRHSEAHAEIIRHAQSLSGAEAEVLLYELVQ